MGTIADLNELTVPNPSTHYLMVRTDAASDKDKKMKLGVFPLKYQTPAANTIVRWRDANTIEASAITLTGTGSLAVGGPSSINGNLTGGGTIALGTFTLTAPATGIAALKSGTPAAGRVGSWSDANTLQDAGFNASDVARLTVANAFQGANTYSALQSFTAGLIPGAGTTVLNVFYRGQWNPVITNTGGSITLSANSGDYMRFGNNAVGQGICFFTLYLTVGTASGGNTSAIRISLPLPVATGFIPPVCSVMHSGIDVTGTGAVGVNFEAEPGTSQGLCRVSYDNATYNNLQGAGILANAIIRISGFYFV